MEQWADAEIVDGDDGDLKQSPQRGSMEEW